MTFPRVRLTVRMMVVIVAAAGVASWLSATAVGVARDPRGGQMSHLRECPDTGETFIQAHTITGDFWPRYWRRLAGRPWPGSFGCPGCRERFERLVGRRLVDIASSDDGMRMRQAMARLDGERQEARMRAMPGWVDR